MAQQQATNAIAQGLKKSLPDRLVDELLDAHREAKTNFYIGGQRLSGVEAGRFCEAALRILQSITTGAFTPIGQSLNSERTIEALSNLPAAAHPDSVRLHIPRCIRMVYDVRNKRDLAHLADGIDPNQQDATLVIGSIDWVLAEFIRLYHRVSADEAHAIIDGIVTRAAPSVQDFDGFLKVLRTDLRAGNVCLLLLYARGERGASFGEISGWVPPKSRGKLRRTMKKLVEQDAHAVELQGLYRITKSGQLEVERQKLIVL